MNTPTLNRRALESAVVTSASTSLVTETDRDFFELHEPAATRNSRHRLPAIGAALLSALLAATVHAQTPVVSEDVKLTSDQLGGAAMDGNLAVALGGGDAHVFRLDGTTWTEEAILSASDGATLQESIAVSGNVIVAGAWAAPNPGPLFGAAYVFRYDGTSWTQEARLTGAGGNFGIGVDIDGDQIVVGAYTQNSQIGAVYVFRHDGTSWNQESMLSASDGVATDQLGRRVAIDGDVVVASAWQADPLGSNSGAAYVYRRGASGWSQEAKLTAPDGAPFDQFSSDVTVDDDVILVGARFDSLPPSLAGSAHVFRYDGSVWNHEAKLTASDPVASGSFGFRVSLCRNVAAVGSPFGNVSGVTSGSAYVYVFDGVSWNETVKLTASDADAGDLFGAGVSACENAMIGASGDDGAGENAGALYFYRFPDTDADGINDYHELYYGTNPLVQDTDGDGLFDGTEVDVAQGGGCPSPTVADSDGDGLSDGAEVALGTSPCNADTDGDMVPDDVDDEPTNPGVSSGYLEAVIRDLCDFVNSLPLDRFAAPNNNARKGRRNAMCNKLNAAANAVAAGDMEGASDQLQSVLAKVDGESHPPDWMVADTEETGVVHDDLDLMIYLISLE